MAEAEPPEKVYFNLPDGYLDWSEERQMEWAREAARVLQQRFGVSPET
jgi:hypothetical protein